MTIGLSTYAFFWQWQPTDPAPLTLPEMIDKTAALGATLLQICDYPPIESYDDDALADLAAHAQTRGVALELGTRGVAPRHLRRYLHLAGQLGVTMVRSMLYSGDHRPAADEAASLLREVVPDFEAAGVTIALETYEQVPVEVLVGVVEQVDSPALGICLDPANCVAALELPDATIARTAPWVRNLHVKDFTFSRRDGWVGFTLAGAPLGTGLLDYDAMVEVVQPTRRGINQIIEHWLPWQGDRETTVLREDQWTQHNLTYLRSKNP